MAIHRVSVTISDPGHTAVHMRSAKTEKRIRVKAETPQEAINKARDHYKKQGYKVHDHNHIGELTEEQAQLDEVKQGQSYTQAQLMKKIQTGNWEATHDIKPGKHVEMRHHTGKRVMVQVKEAKDPREYDYEGDMAKSQLRAIIANAQQVHDMLKDNTNMAEWVQSKITLAADYISTVADYMQSEVKEDTQMDEAAQGHTIEAHGVKGMKSTPWRKTFKHADHLNDWAEKNDAEVHGTRDLEQSHKVVKEESDAYAKAEENKRSADAAKKQGDMFAHHLHMADHHDNLAQWHGEKGRHSVADTHAAKSEEHHDLAMQHKDGVNEAKDLEYHRSEFKKTSDKIDRIVQDGGRVGIADPLSRKLKQHSDMIKKHRNKVTEAWTQGNRNPQRGIKVGDKVRSYDFPGMHDDHYVEGHVVADNAHTYHIRVNKVVRGGKEIPTPAHMAHVEAPKGKGMFSSAYAVHRMMSKEASVAAKAEPAQGAARTFTAMRGKK